MSGAGPILAGLSVLALAWGGPLPGWVAHSFTAHMVLHMTVVGVGVPLVALGLARRGVWQGWGTPGLMLVASLADLVVVWGWHAPMLHDASRSHGVVLALEQASFALAALVLWGTVLGGPPLVGALALFLTSMHMVLLGALLGLAPRLLFHDHGGEGLDPVTDQQLGGVVMMALGSVIYLGAATMLAARALSPERVR